MLTAVVAGNSGAKVPVRSVDLPKRLSADGLQPQRTQSDRYGFGAYRMTDLTSDNDYDILSKLSGVSLHQIEHV